MLNKSFLPSGFLLHRWQRPKENAGGIVKFILLWLASKMDNKEEEDHKK